MCVWFCFFWSVFTFSTFHRRLRRRHHHLHHLVVVVVLFGCVPKRPLSFSPFLHPELVENLSCRLLPNQAAISFPPDSPFIVLIPPKPLSSALTALQRAMNVLIYSGEGTSLASVTQTQAAASKLLGLRYDVKKVSAEVLHNEPWPVRRIASILSSGSWTLEGKLNPLSIPSMVSWRIFVHRRAPPC